jgi:release factor glutamine methyltransferase
MTLSEAKKNLIHRLEKWYDAREAGNIAEWLLESITGWGRMDQLLNGSHAFTEAQQTQYDKGSLRLEKGEPIQYVLEEAWFMGRRFTVNKNTLIPRPETEELVNWIRKEHTHTATQDGHDQLQSPTILDVGTGSGCIAVSLQLDLPQATVYALDTSAGALETAAKNATALNAPIRFIEQDFLQEADWPVLPSVDILVSNPPYIAIAEAITMHTNVLDYEPFMALFVPDENPLVFYEALARFGQRKLNKGGLIYAEINERLGEVTREIFTKEGYDVILQQDMQGKDRMLRASKVVG